MANQNKYNRNLTTSNPFVKNVTLPGDGGIYAGNPAPGFRNYPQSKGKTLPPTKFAETDLAISKGTKVNNMERSVQTPSIAEEMGLKIPTSETRIITGRNRYQTSVKSNNLLKK